MLYECMMFAVVAFVLQIALILMPLVLMLLLTYYCQNYATMIGTSLFFHGTDLLNITAK